MQWSLDQLRQFVATAEQGSISAAARHLGKAQSAVSTAVSLLEADLNVALFDRTTHRATLSNAGRLMLLEAREVLRQAAALDQRARSLVDRNDATLALALDEALPFNAICTLLRETSARFPNLELTLLNGTANEVADYVDQAHADVAFHFDRGPLPDRFDQRHIGTLPQAIFVASDHPLLDKETIKRSDLAHHRQLVMTTERAEERVYSPKVWRSDSFYTIAEMVADDLGWAILPVNVALSGNYAKPLRQVSCPALSLPLLSVRMLWNQGRLLNMTAHWVEQRLIELMQESS